MLTEKQKQIARGAYLGTLSGGEFLDVYAAVEAVLAEQARAAEQPPTGDAVEKMRRAAREALGHGSGMIDSIQMSIILSAVLPIARAGYVSQQELDLAKIDLHNAYEKIEGMVSLEDVEKEIRRTLDAQTILGETHIRAIANTVRARLAKPAAQTERVTWIQLANGNALVRLDGNGIAIFYRGPYDPKYAHDCAERYAAELREEIKEAK